MGYLRRYPPPAPPLHHPKYNHLIRFISYAPLPPSLTTFRLVFHFQFSPLFSFLFFFFYLPTLFSFTIFFFLFVVVVNLCILFFVIFLTYFSGDVHEKQITTRATHSHFLTYKFFVSIFRLPLVLVCIVPYKEKDILRNAFGEEDKVQPNFERDIEIDLLSPVSLSRLAGFL